MTETKDILLLNKQRYFKEKHDYNVNQRLRRVKQNSNKHSHINGDLKQLPGHNIYSSYGARSKSNTVSNYC